MFSDNLRETARKGDLSAIAGVIKQAFTRQEVHVEAEMQFGVTLWLKLKSDGILDSQDSLNVVAEALNSIKPQGVTAVRVSTTPPKNLKQQMMWNKHLALKQGKFVDNTKETNQVGIVVCGLAAFGLLFAMFTQKPASTTSPSSGSSTSAQVINSDEEAQFILSEVTQKYGFSRFFDTWGAGTQGLFLPEKAWNELSLSQRNALMDYAQSKKFKAIVVGKQLAPNNIALDRTVWGE